MSLEFIWFTVVVILLTGYIILDGFDLGVGMLHLFSTDDTERRIMLNTIGPVWDGNEVWLVTAVGALLAGFPNVYATLLSSFYVPVMVFLGGIIFRAVAIEFRSKQPMAWWRWTWDALFSLASLIITFFLGIFLGNMIRGIPLNENWEYTGTLADLFHPYALLIGLMAVAFCFMHGGLFVVMKTEGALHDRMRKWILPSVIFFILSDAIVTMVTLIYMPHMTDNIRERPVFFIVALLSVLAVANIPREINRGRDGWAFISSCFTVVGLLALYGIGTYPIVVRAINDPENLSLTIYNAASSQKTLQILLLIAIIGVPLVLSYTITIYRIFRGKVRLESTSY